MARLKAGERLKGLREITGLTQAEFAEVTGLSLIRLRNLEHRKARVAEDEFEKIGELFPEFVHWMTYEGDISIEDLKNSDQLVCRLFAAKIAVDAGQIPAGYHLEDKLK